MPVPYVTRSVADQIAKERLNDCVQIKHGKFPNSSHVVSQADIDAGTYDAEFLGANWIHGTLYSYCFVSGQPVEFSKWLVVGNDATTTNKAFNHSIPERDVDGRLYTRCQLGGYSSNTDNMVTNVAAVKYIVAENIPEFTATEDGTYVLKVVKNGETVTRSWVKE